MCIRDRCQSVHAADAMRAVDEWSFLCLMSWVLLLWDVISSNNGTAHESYQVPGNYVIDQIGTSVRYLHPWSSWSSEWSPCQTGVHKHLWWNWSVLSRITSCFFAFCVRAHLPYDNVERLRLYSCFLQPFNSLCTLQYSHMGLKKQYRTTSIRRMKRMGSLADVVSVGDTEVICWWIWWCFVSIRQYSR